MSRVWYDIFCHVRDFAPIREIFFIRVKRLIQLIVNHRASSLIRQRHISWTSVHWKIISLNFSKFRMFENSSSIHFRLNIRMNIDITFSSKSRFFSSKTMDSMVFSWLKKLPWTILILTKLEIFEDFSKTSRQPKI